MAVSRAIEAKPVTSRKTSAGRTPARERTPTKTTKCDVSVVLPCLNEEESVGVCVQNAWRWLRETGVTGEVIVVDNGSTDRSAEVALKAGARVVKELRRGKGRACLRGFEAASGRIIVLGDADATYDFADIGLLTEPLHAGYDLVIGNRLTDGMGPGAMSWSHRRIGNPLISLCVRLFAGVRVSDSLSGFRAFTRQAFQRMGLRSEAFEIECEMILRAAAQGLRIAEVPISYHPRKGDSKLRTFSDGWYILRFLLLNTPTYLFMIPGAALVLLGLLSLGISLGAGGGVTVGTLTWQPVFAGGILLIVGTNALMIGMASHMYAASRGIVAEGGLTLLYRQYLTLERVLALAGLLLLIGVGLDGLIFYQWVSRDDLGLSTAGIAALAQSSIIIGANLALGGFLVALMDVE